jgi:DMSO/TMAO reductase YedYZ heme-binding membrane subunit
MSKALKNRALNGWSLFWIISGPISLAMITGMLRSDLSSGPAVSSMIQVSVRCAVPWLYLAFAASSVQILWPGPLGLWLSRNRKFLGLCFAAAMAWQGFFILWMVFVYSDYYINEVYVMRDAIEGVVGYLFLTAMTLTSFMPVRKRMTPKSWKLLHKSGIYFLWAYAFSVYWWNLFYYDSPGWLDYTYYWAAFAAWSLRAAAWTKKRRKQRAKSGIASTGYALFGVLANVAIGVGLVAAAFGKAWYPTAANLMTGYSFTRVPELYVPYWPFEPWLPVFIIALGAYLISRSPQAKPI